MKRSVEHGVVARSAANQASLLVALLSGSMALSGCGVVTATDDGGTTGSNPDPAADGAAAPRCNTVALGTTGYVNTMVPAALPSATGGAIPDGTYDISASTYYTGTGGASTTTTIAYHATLVIAGNEGQSVQDDATGGEPIRTNYALTTNGSMLTFTPTCGTGARLSYPYVASPSQLVVYDGWTSPQPFTETWTRR